MDIRPNGNVTQPNSVANERTPADLPSATKTAAPPVETNTVIKQPDPSANAAQVTQAIKNINKALESRSQTLEFSIDEDSQRTIVKVIDQSTKIVIRQIPTGEVLEIAKAIDQAQGLLIRQMA